MHQPGHYTPRPIHVLAIAGSLRRASHNKGLLRAAQHEAPAGMTIDIFDLAPIPLFNEDVLNAGAPEPVRYFKERIAAADALLIAVTEYNYGLSGVLKNAIDWASRPVNTSPLTGKPLAMMGAGGMFGTVRAQLQLRQTAVYTNMLPMNRPELMITHSWEKFDGEGNLTDEHERAKIRPLLEGFAAWVRRLRGE